jgi:hypothetical protein
MPLSFDRLEFEIHLPIRFALGQEEDFRILIVSPLDLEIPGFPIGTLPRAVRIMGSEIGCSPQIIGRWPPVNHGARRVGSDCRLDGG